MEEKWKVYDITADVYYFGDKKQAGEIISSLLKQGHCVRVERSRAYVG